MNIEVAGIAVFSVDNGAQVEQNGRLVACRSIGMGVVGNMSLEQSQKPREDAHNTLREEAYRQFMIAMLNRKVRPGRMLSQRELAEWTGSSLASMREALKRLEGEGVVKLIPKRGVLITEVTRKDIADAYDFRILIETHAIRHYVANCDPAEVKSIRAQTEEILATIPDEKGIEHFNKCLEIDRKLHRQIVATLGNSAMSDTHQSIETTMMLARLNLPAKLNAGNAAFEEHLNMLDAIESGDPENAAASLREHLIKARERAMEFAEL